MSLESNLSADPGGNLSLGGGAEAAREPRAVLETILELMPVPVLLVELGTARIVFANRAAYALSEGVLTRDRNGDVCIAAAECTDAGGERIDTQQTPWARVARGEQFSGLQMDWCLPSGVRTLLVSGDMLPSGMRHPARGLVAFQDATELKRAERAQRETAEELQRRSEELMRSNEDLQQFAFVASHDLQEPLRTVSSYARMLETRYAGNLDHDAGEFINFIVDGTRRMSTLIQDLLAFSRAVGAQGTGFDAQVDTAGVVEMATANLSGAIRESQATITRGELPVITGDHAQLVQLFQNLIGNAIKYRGADPPRVDVTARKDNQEWVFSVRDNGIGIDPRYADRIFLPFKRLHGREYPGTGVGLAIAKKIVERHGGRIWVESLPGEGATFWFTLAA